MLIRRILVPVDFSDRSRPLLDYALQLAELSSAAVDVLHVVPGPGPSRAAVDAYLGRPLPHATDHILAAARVELQELIDGRAGGTVAPTLHVEPGDPASAIVRLAAELPADLVVMGTRGHRGLAELLLGSVTHKVITCAGCPVVTLGEGAARAAHETA